MAMTESWQSTNRRFVAPPPYEPTHDVEYPKYNQQVGHPLAELLKSVITSRPSRLAFVALVVSVIADK